MPSTPREQCAVLGCTAAFAFLWVVARACVQSVTIDEADTYLAYVSPTAPTHWLGSANNQLLNSLLMRLFTSIFGTWHLSVRAPALIGATLYIAAALVLARAVSERLTVAWPLLVCLVYNPFVMDHLVAARGYSLALGLWLAAMAIAVRRPFGLYRNCALVSVCAALSFASNFSFAFADAALVLCVMATCRSWKAASACVAPGFAVALFLTGSVIATWPANQLVYGAESLSEMFATVMRSSLCEVNPFFVNPPLHDFLVRYAEWLFPMLCAATVCRLVSIRSRQDGQRLAALGAIAGFTIAAHWTLFRAFHVLLPKDRTAIFFAPLAFLIAGVAAAMPAVPGVARKDPPLGRSVEVSWRRWDRIARPAATAALAVCAVYFVLCLRLTYFREWKFDADVKEMYSILAYYNENYGIREILPDWRYNAALNFYRFEGRHDSLPPFEYNLPPYPAGREMYVMDWSADEAFLKANGLRVVYRGALSNAVIAIRPELADEPPLFSGRLLLRHAVQGAESPNQLRAVDACNLVTRETAREH